MAALEAYTKPQSNQILARYQLRCLKQRDKPLEEFVTEARLLVEDGGYDLAAKENALRDTLVFGVASDKVRKDAIALGNSLTFKQVYDLAKVDESTKAQMKIISKRDEKSDLHTVQREPAKNFKHQTPYGDQNPKDSTGRNLVDFSSSQKDASGAETPTIDQQIALPKIPNAGTVARTAITQGCVCSNAFKRFTRSWVVQSTRDKTST